MKPSSFQTTIENQFDYICKRAMDFQIFTLNGLSVGVEIDLLSEALRELPDKKREILLLFYLWEFRYF